MALQIRQAQNSDAEDMANLLNTIIEAGGTTAWMTKFDDAEIVKTFIAPPLQISCFVAVASGHILGFQQLEWCDPNWPGEDALPADWALISTFVSENARGLGAGRSLFEETLNAARAAKVATIDATIRADNRPGLAFYTRIGFADFSVMRDVALADGSKVDRIKKRFDLQGAQTCP